MGNFDLDPKSYLRASGVVGTCTKYTIWVSFLNGRVIHLRCWYL